MTRLDDALEFCLLTMANGATMESALAPYPELRRDLEPLLLAAIRARDTAVPAMPVEAHRRGRSQFLQRAAELREARFAPRRRILPALPRTALTFGMVGILLLTSTGLVRASSTSLPGDQLYRVKRSWEGIQIYLAAHPQQQYKLESTYEQERLDEIDELLARGRSVPISFSGLVMRKSDTDWVVSGIPVSIGPETQLPRRLVEEGLPVLVTGTTNPAGVVDAKRIQILQAGAALPPLQPSLEDHGEDETSEGGEPAVAVPSQPGAGMPAPTPNAHAVYQFTGIVERLGTEAWLVNGQQVSVQGAQILGSIKVGSEIRFEGHYTDNGLFVATLIERTSNISYEEKVESDDSGTDKSHEAEDDPKDEHEGEDEGADH